MKNTQSARPHGLVVNYIISEVSDDLAFDLENLIVDEGLDAVDHVEEVAKTSVSKVVDRVINHYEIYNKSMQAEFGKKLTDMASSVDSTLREIQETAWELGDFMNADDEKVRLQRMQYREVLRLCATVRKIIGDVIEG